MLSAVCPSCRTDLRAGDSAAGTMVPCPRCGKSFLLRAASDAYDVVLDEGDVEVVGRTAKEERVRDEEELEVVDEPADKGDEDGPILEEGDPFEGVDLTERAKRRVCKELDEGEFIVWVGRPSLRLLPRRIGMGLPVGLLFVVVSLFSLPGMLGVLLRGGPSHYTLISCVGLACVGLFTFAFGALICAHALGLYLIRLFPSVRAIYVLTNRRALLFGSPWSIRRYYPEDVADMRVREVAPYDGGGDLIFDDVEAVRRRGGEAMLVQVPRGFLWVENVRKVKGLVRKALCERRG